MTQIAANSVAEPLCVYIAARGHSGSTMFELLLNRYPEIAAVGEVDQLPLQIVRDGIHTRWVGMCSCEARPSDCEVWSAVYERAASELGVDLTADPFGFPVSDVGLAQEFGLRRPVAYLKLAMHRAVRNAAHHLGVRLPRFLPYRSWVRNRELVYRVIAEKRGVSAIVDASKDAMQMSDLVKYSELPVKVLYLTRPRQRLVRDPQKWCFCCRRSEKLGGCERTDSLTAKSDSTVIVVASEIRRSMLRYRRCAGPRSEISGH